MKKYLFELGSHKGLSVAEISSLLSGAEVEFNIVSESGKFLIIETEAEMELEKLLPRLGGTLQVARYVMDIENIEYDIAAALDQLQPEGKIVFSFLGENAKKVGIAAKKELKSMKRSVRYVEAKNSATIIHNNLIEKKGNLVQCKKSLYLTVWVQPIEELSKRDYDRPGKDSKSGMLPPKLARILINLSQAKLDETILDPFCGSGTIPMEAASMGYKNILGSDLSDKAVKDSKVNVEWVKKEFPETADAKIEIRQADVKKIGNLYEKESIDAIMFEPYMGKPLYGSELEAFLRGQARELKDLFEEAFENFKLILKSGGKVVAIIPQFFNDGNWIKVDFLERVRDLGFEIDPLLEEKDFILYHRPGQHVGRMVWRFVKK